MFTSLSLSFCRSVTPSTFIELQNQQNAHLIKAEVSRGRHCFQCDTLSYEFSKLFQPQPELPSVITQSLQQANAQPSTFSMSPQCAPQLSSSSSSPIVVTSSTSSAAAGSAAQLLQQQQQHLEPEPQPQQETAAVPKQENIEDILSLLLQQGGGKDIVKS